MSPLVTPRRRGVANAGPRRSAARRRAATSTHHVLEGRLAWIDGHGSRVVLRVDSANRRARRFVGTTVTVYLAGARVSAPDRDGDGRLSAADLLPGERVTVTAKLPRHLERTPGVLSARSVLCHSFD